MKKLLSLLSVVAVVITLTGCQLSVDDVTVTVDPDAPVITVVSGTVRMFDVNDTAPDWTTYFTVEDEVDGSITVEAAMLSWDPAIDMGAPGIYTLTVTAEDDQGHEVEKDILITVGVTLTDTTAPVITSNPNTLNLIFDVNDVAPDWKTYFSVTDDKDGAIIITDAMLTWTPAVDMAVAGVYALTITVSDEAGNEGTSSLNITVQTP